MKKGGGLHFEEEHDFFLSTKGSSNNFKGDKKSSASQEKQKYLKSLKKQYSVDMSSKRKVNQSQVIQEKQKHTVTFQSIVNENLIYDQEYPSILEVHPHEDSNSSRYIQQ
eukprot:CAMPEP_0170548782 /NCGR_PEP_ID=MMETSP0211-20121228/6975_1 /TAXON_ID=311385 /ORGANISM="Pseudokeronopsis sp., Strain OXSARD2" /LENGTH=109 /DNA_ID=CAMNT_0010854415 /DNA_START=3038 /DNA_END=3367 /DNA_ORIENTATION=+